MNSIKRHRNAMVALLAEYIDRGTNAIETSSDTNDYTLEQKRYLTETTIAKYKIRSIPSSCAVLKAFQNHS